MTEDEIIALFERDDDAVSSEFLKHESILPERVLSKRKDLNAFMLLDKLCPGPNEYGYYVDVVGGASHDEIYLSISASDLAEAGATREDIIDLIRCGVRYSDEALRMFA